MPNHFTNIALCGPGYDFDCEAFNEAKFNLCAEIIQCPQELYRVHSGFTRQEDGTVLERWIDTPEGPVEVDRQSLIERFGHDCSIEWQRANWGVKWGTYDTVARHVGGDSMPVLIEFQTAWGPPSILDKIAEWLKARFGFLDVGFMGFDPYDDSVYQPEYQAIDKATEGSK